MKYCQSNRKCNQDVFITYDRNYIIIFKWQLFFRAVIFLSSEKAYLKQLGNGLTVFSEHFFLFFFFFFKFYFLGVGLSSLLLVCYKQEGNGMTSAYGLSL